jgi:hypothetical protein
METFPANRLDACTTIYYTRKKDIILMVIVFHMKEHYFLYHDVSFYGKINIQNIEFRYSQDCLMIYYK